MIQINLLPKEMQVRKKEMSFPIQRWLLLAIIVLFLVWLALLLESGYIHTRIGRLAQSFQGMKVTHGDAQKLFEKVDKVYRPTVEYFDIYVQKHMTWAPTLNVISDELPGNMWLTMLKAEDTSKLWALTIRGVARPYKGRPSIRIIGNYASGLRSDFVKIEKTVPLAIEPGAPTVGSDEIEVTTTTKRKVAGNIAITEFLTIFTRSYE